MGLSRISARKIGSVLWSLRDCENRTARRQVATNDGCYLVSREAVARHKGWCPALHRAIACSGVGTHVAACADMGFENSGCPLPVGACGVAEGGCLYYRFGPEEGVRFDSRAARGHWLAAALGCPTDLPRCDLSY